MRTIGAFPSTVPDKSSKSEIGGHVGTYYSNTREAMTGTASKMTHPFLSIPTDRPARAKRDMPALTFELDAA